MSLKYLLAWSFVADAELDQRTSRLGPAALSDQGNKPVLLAPDKKKKHTKVKPTFFCSSSDGLYEKEFFGNKMAVYIYIYQMFMNLKYLLGKFLFRMNAELQNTNNNFVVKGMFTQLAKNYLLAQAVE